MDTDPVTPSGQPIVSREKVGFEDFSATKPDQRQTAPFLIRTFVKLGGHHRLTLFEDGALPTTDEHQIFTWCVFVLLFDPVPALTTHYRRDATLREVLTTLRASSSATAQELRHPLARYHFHAVYADPTARGRFATKDIGTVYSRDILGEPGALHKTAPRLLDDGDAREASEREREERTLDELRFVPGDYMSVAVLLPKNLTAVGPGGEISIKGAGVGAPPTPTGGPPPGSGWKGRGDGGWGGGAAPPSGPPGRGGGHWRGESNPVPGPRGRGRGGREFPERDRDRDRDDRRPPPPRRSPPPLRGGRGRDRSFSRSRSPPRRRNSRYD